jgi:HSP20 family protein
MASFTFYEPFYSQLERLLSDSSLEKQSPAAGRNDSPVVRSFKPRLDLHEDKEKNIVTAIFEFPGFLRREIQLDFQNGRLTVSAQKMDEQSGNTLPERFRGKFERTIQLPRGVKNEQIKATMDHGLLIVTFPKTVPELAPKKIVISGA